MKNPSTKELAPIPRPSLGKIEKIQDRQKNKKEIDDIDTSLLKPHATRPTRTRNAHAMMPPSPNNHSSVLPQSQSSLIGLGLNLSFSSIPKIPSSHNTSTMAVDGSAPASPISIPELTKITSEACDAALSSTTEYDHAVVGDWNSQIINTVLKALIAATSPSDSSKPAPYRFTVNSTIVQQGVIDKSAAADGAQNNAGKRGMHSASGAFWDVNRDGMWTFKYPGAEERGLDVVVSVTWFAVV